MIGVNLIPADVRLRRCRRQRVRGWAACNAILGIVVALPLVMEWLDQAKAEELRRRSLEVQQKLSAAQTELRAVRDEADQLHLQIQRADALRSKRAWSGMLGLIAERMPEGAWLTQLATDPAAPKAGRAAATPQTGTATARPGTGGAAPAAKGGTSVVTIEAPRKLRLIGYAATPAEPLILVTNLKKTGVFARVGLEQSQADRVDGKAIFRFEVLCEW